MAKTKKNKIKKQEVNQDINFDIANKAIQLVDDERKSWENALVYVTDKVAFDIRNLIKTLRKNFWGIFDNDRDPISGNKMTWVPLTEFVCDTYSKNSEVDSKDLNVRSKKPGGIGYVSFVRSLLRNWFDEEVIGEDLDETTRQLAIDGSHIWKTYKSYNEKGKAKMIRTDVDILNTYFDMTSNSIQDAYRFTERSLLTPYEIKQMDGWINTEDITGSTGLHPSDNRLNQSTTGTSKFVDVWETWGKIPKYLITGNKEDTEMVEGHIVVSGLDGGKDDSKRVHLIETNPGGLKPYEEIHTKKIKGRWLAKGPAESVMFLQSWINMIVNIRKTRAMVSQLGIFKLKKGSGVTPQNFSKMAANGVLTVNNMDDIEQFVMKEASESSYKDESMVFDWSQRVTASYEVATGESLPSSTPATNAVIQSRSAGSTFKMFRDQINFGLKRWVNRHAIPILQDIITPGEVYIMTGDLEDMKKYDDVIINYLVKEKLDKDAKNGIYYDTNSVLQVLESEKRKFLKMGKERYVNLINKINLSDYYVDFYVTNESLDMPTLTNNLLSVLKIAPEYRETVVNKLFDIMGIDTRELDKKSELVNQPNTIPNTGVGLPQDNVVPQGTEQQLVTNANLPI